MSVTTLSRLFLIIVGITLGAAVPAAAQQIPAATVAVVDFQRILREATAAVSIRDQIEKQRAIYQQQINTEEQDLRRANQELARQRTILSAEAFAQKRRDFESRVSDVQRRVQARKRELEEASALGLKEVEQALTVIVADLSKSMGFNLVLARRQIMFADRALNISDEVLTLLNERLPTVKVPLAKN